MSALHRSCGQQEESCRRIRLFVEGKRGHGVHPGHVVGVLPCGLGRRAERDPLAEMGELSGSGAARGSSLSKRKPQFWRLWNSFVGIPGHFEQWR